MQRDNNNRDYRRDDRNSQNEKSSGYNASDRDRNQEDETRNAGNRSSGGSQGFQEEDMNRESKNYNPDERNSGRESMRTGGTDFSDTDSPSRAEDSSDNRYNASDRDRDNEERRGSSRNPEDSANLGSSGRRREDEV